MSDLRTFANDFRQVSLQRTSMARAIPMLRSDLRAYLSRVPQRPLSLALGQDGSGVLQRVAAAPAEAGETCARILLPRRRNDRYWLFGVKNVIRSPRHTYALRAKAVRAGLFPRSILYIPPTRPPFAYTGQAFVKRKINTYIGGPTDSTLEKVCSDVLSETFQQWGFR